MVTRFKSVLLQLSDLFFGYDYFISYQHGDGLICPGALSERLQSLGYHVFLDRTGYAAGDDLSTMTRRRVRMSSYLIVVARPGALTRSDWVMREVHVCIGAGRTPIIVDVDRCFLTLTVADADADADAAETARLTNLRTALENRLRIPETSTATVGEVYDGERP